MGIQLKTSVLLSPVENGYLAYQIHTRRLHHLNPTAALIVELCDGSRDIDQLRDVLLPLLGDDEWRQCAAWIASALEDGVLGDSASNPQALSADALGVIANGLREDGRVLEAFVCQQRAAELAPKNPDTWYALGELAHIVGRRADARAAYERYFQHHPEDAEIAHILTALRDEPAPTRASPQFIEQLYSRFASFYDKSMSEDLEYRAPALLFDALARALDNGLPASPASPISVLDLGCGTGLSGRLWRERARRLVGIDLSSEMIARAREQKLYDALQVAEITDWLSRRHGHGDAAGGLPDRFEVIIACDALIYFGDLRQVLCPARPWLAEGGLMGFTVEQSHDADPFRLSDSGRFIHHPDHIIDAARDAGLSIVSLDEDVLRYEYGEPVRGLIAVLRA